MAPSLALPALICEANARLERECHAAADGLNPHIGSLELEGGTPASRSRWREVGWIDRGINLIGRAQHVA
jgi:hypothetical protein